MPRCAVQTGCVHRGGRLLIRISAASPPVERTSSPEEAVLNTAQDGLYAKRQSSRVSCGRGPVPPAGALAGAAEPRVRRAGRRLAAWASPLAAGSARFRAGPAPRPARWAGWASPIGGVAQPDLAGGPARLGGWASPIWGGGWPGGRRASHPPDRAQTTTYGAPVPKSKRGGERPKTGTKLFRGSPPPPTPQW